MNICIYILFVIQSNKLTHSIKIRNNSSYNIIIPTLGARLLFIRRPGIGFYRDSFDIAPYYDNFESKYETLKHFTETKAKNNFYEGNSGFVDYYKILSLDKSCTAEDVRSKYEHINESLKSLPGVDPKLRSDIDKAYRVLSNKKMRDEYDRSYEQYAGPEDMYYMESLGDSNEDDMDDTSEELEISIMDDDEEVGPNFGTNLFGNFFSNLFGSKKSERRKGNQSMRKRGSSKFDVSCNAEIDLKTLLLGGEVTVPVRKWDHCNFCNFNESASKSYIDTCTRCNGQGMEHKVGARNDSHSEKRSPFGFVRTSRTCMKCQGTGHHRLKDCNKCENTGRVLRDTTVKVEVPFNAKIGSVITVKGKGHYGGLHMKDGNLHVKLNLKENKNEYIEAGRIVTVYNIPYTKAILGDKVRTEGVMPVTVATFMGDKQVEVPAYSQQGDEIKIGSYKDMDHYVKLNVQLPKNLSEKELELLNKIDKI
ncbi:uncharacterized protein TOT_020000253 [Theileria orientalis strain Shintoku]|uniref:Molecular chaperone DnaJ n=1 Tax=Theileria orientalis strain Shintoku TaxID=869250 RepID=J4C382_THEOR|nr:LOW QUALITY PROTEIN: uncharacterized protein TOT_020000253 [Theileria orientalis strain Shintoku]BAM39986.1 uncharacterized protein TOT_020000253 [Theileria orientalis strain Shintoku]|eukprot:XP_009690287.1 LOW QUALITY PROTEIN: uncharacterized protein TOT_020000253 [Theileria orientalis strain Shintoku]